MFSYKSTLLLVVTLTTFHQCQGQGQGKGKDAVREIMVNRLPDPMTSPKACGRYAPSHVCDPDNILPDKYVNQIDDLLKEIYNETTVPCYSVGPQASKRKGYIVMLAVVPKMAKYFTAGAPDTYLIRYIEAIKYAYYLGTSDFWGKHSSNCKEVVILLYSKADNVIYTSTQSTARAVLNDDIVRETNMDLATYFVPFTKGDNAARALSYMAKKYSMVLKRRRPSN